MSGCCKQPSHLIVYGIKRKQSDVSSDVYDDSPYTYENNKVAFKTGVEFSKVTKFDALVDFLKATNFNEHMNMNMNNYINVLFLISGGSASIIYCVAGPCITVLHIETMCST